MSKKAIWTIIIILVLLGLWWVIAATNGTEDVMEPASVEATDQVAGDSLVVDRVVLEEDGFVVVRNEEGEVVGQSDHMEAGEHEDVEVELIMASEAGDRFEVVLFRDTDGDQTFDLATDIEVTQDAGGSARGDVSGGVVSDFIVIIGDVEEEDEIATTTEGTDDNGAPADEGAGAGVDVETDGSLDSGLY